jgi:hypothetical protein
MTIKPPIKARGALILATLCVLGAFAWKPDLYYTLGVNTYGLWFHDTFAILASLDAQRLGIDVYRANPLDYFGRPHVYSQWWLYAGQFGLTRADTVWLSLMLVGSYLAVALAQLRPGSGREALFQGGILLAPPLLLAINRANNDLVIFLVLALLPRCLLDGRRLVRFSAVFLVAVATGLKYYPLAAALLLLVAPSREELRARLVVFALVMAIVGVSLAEDLMRFGSLAPHTEGLITFGATAIPVVLGSAWKGWTLLAWALGGGAFGVLLWRAWRRQAAAASEGPAPSREELGFVLGASLLCACFWLGMNHGYRWVFALWLAPWLWRQWHDETRDAATRALAKRTAWLLLAVLWIDSAIAFGLNRLLDRFPLPLLLKWANGLYIAEQPVTWTFFLCLLAWLARFGVGVARGLGREADPRRSSL